MVAGRERSESPHFSLKVSQKGSLENLTAPLDVGKRLMHGTGLNSVEGAGLFHLLKHWGGILGD